MFFNFFIEQKQNSNKSYHYDLLLYLLQSELRGPTTKSWIVVSWIELWPYELKLNWIFQNSTDLHP